MIYTEPEDKQLIKDIGIVFILAGVLIFGMLSVMIFIFFYGSPLLVAWSFLLIMFKIRICDSGLIISLEKFIQKYLKIKIAVIHE